MLSAGKGSTEPGFTLLELLVVMSIMGLMAVFALPLLSRSLDSVRFDGAAGKLAAAGRKARSEAMTARKPRWLIIDVESDSFWLADRPGEDAEPAPDAVRAMPSVVDILGFRFVDGRVAGEIATVRFDPNGSSSGGTVRMARAGREGRGTKEIFFEPFTGLPTVAEQRGDASW